MNARNFVLFAAVICFGCDHFDGELFSSTTSSGVGGSGGGGGSSSVGTSGYSGEKSSTTSSGGSSSDSSTTTSGASCTPKITCQSIGAECGVILDDGCGTSDCGDNCIAPKTCGGGGDQFKCGCTPKTCFQLGKNCGVIDDGCGNQIDCGGCDPAKYQTNCGESGWDLMGNYLPAANNVCGGGCEAIDVFNVNYDCAKNFPQYPHEWHCAQPNSNNPPPCGSPCVLIPTFQDNQWWCCANGK